LNSGERPARLLGKERKSPPAEASGLFQERADLKIVRSKPGLAVTTAAAVEAASAAAVEAAARVTVGRAAAIAMRYAANVTVRSAGNISTAGISVSTAVAVAVSAMIAVEARMTIPAPVIPGTDADKDAAEEPARPVIAIGGAGIRVIGVIAPRAIRGTVIDGGGDHCGADADTNCDLGARRGNRGERENEKQCQ
jgi:hypothetical protein